MSHFSSTQFLFCKYDANGNGIDISDSSSTASKSTSSDDEQTVEPAVDVCPPQPAPVTWGFKGECGKCQARLWHLIWSDRFNQTRFLFIGPSEWHKFFPHAGGKKQSPVDIPSSNAIFCEKLAKAPFKVNYDEKCTTKIENNGKIFRVTGDSPESGKWDEGFNLEVWKTCQLTGCGCGSSGHWRSGWLRVQIHAIPHALGPGQHWRFRTHYWRQAICGRDALCQLELLASRWYDCSVVCNRSHRSHGLWRPLDPGSRESRAGEADPLA